MTNQIVKFEFNSKGVRGDDERKMLCLTDMWRADGADPSRAPAQWCRKEGKAYLRFLRAIPEVTGGHIGIYSEKGGKDHGGSTWAIPKVALAYGMYLSTAFQDHCLSIILAVYSDGGYVLPGREREFLSRLDTLSAIVAQYDAQNLALIERISKLDTPNGLVRPDQAKMIRSAINAISVDENQDETLSLLVAYRLVDNRLRHRLSPPFTTDTGGKWGNLPLARFGEVMSELARMHDEVRAKARSIAKHAAKKAATRQGTIDFDSAKRRRHEAKP